MEKRRLRGSSLRQLLALLVLALLITACAGNSLTSTEQAMDPGRVEDAPWIYLRDGRPLQGDETPVEVAVVGDTSLARGVDVLTAFQYSAGWLSQADVALVNLECALTERPARGEAEGVDITGPYRLTAKPEAARALSEAGIDIAGLANNHTLDAGPEGLSDTLQALERVGVVGLGAGSDAEAAAVPLVKTARGLKVAFLAFNAIPSPDPLEPGWMVRPWQESESIAAVRRAAMQSDAVVVGLHWGYEYQTQASSTQVAIAQALIAAGADLVIGHHPHVTQAALLQARADGSSGLAAFSLGNFVFDQGAGSPAGEKVNHGLALRAFFDRDGLRAVQALPVRTGLRPVLLTADTDPPTVTSGAPQWEEIHFSCDGQGCQETPPDNASGIVESGIFRSGKIDLDGDRQPEEVRLENFRISIDSGGELVWQSPTEWRVLDLTPGDPDGDGRSDLVLALEKPDAQGNIQSHPFVIGYRGGLYRTIWGGSPVRDPVKEVELADLNGDGQSELLVLEEERGGKGRAVTIWHWHGWGFSLDWRSQYGEYEQMAAATDKVWVKKLR